MTDIYADEMARRMTVPVNEIIVANMQCNITGITAWFNEFDSWCTSQNVQAVFFNHWTDEAGNHASYHIPDETQRLWAKLKYE